MKKIQTVNPFTGTVLKEYEYATDAEVLSCLQTASLTEPVWSVTKIEERCVMLKNLATLLGKSKTTLAKLITDEMGKPIKQSLSEIEKCVTVCDFYIKNSSQFLADAVITSINAESFISHDPLGTILGIMPWNYPFWQVIRFAVPTIIAGNVVILKHAENVMGSALIMERLFIEAGFPRGCFQVLRADHQQIKNVIRDDIIKGVSFTGSAKTGCQLGKLAGESLKKTVMELGGNNACVVWEDADLKRHVDSMVYARMQNNGQSCIAAKRFVVVEAIYETFLEMFTERIKALRIGDPTDLETDISVMAKQDLVTNLQHQIDTSIAMGAKVVIGNKRDGTFFQPTILTEVTTDMPVFTEETFGPVAAVCKVPNRQAAIDLAANSKYGLGTMLFTQNLRQARMVIGQIPDGAFFVNEKVLSNPQLPFGGTKNSGYGRELSLEGMLTFTNKKTVYIKK